MAVFLWYSTGFGGSRQPFSMRNRLGLFISYFYLSFINIFFIKAHYMLNIK